MKAYGAIRDVVLLSVKSSTPEEANNRSFPPTLSPCLFPTNLPRLHSLRLQRDYPPGEPHPVSSGLTSHLSHTVDVCFNSRCRPQGSIITEDPGHLSFMLLAGGVSIMSRLLCLKTLPCRLYPLSPLDRHKKLSSHYGDCSPHIMGIVVP